MNSSPLSLERYAFKRVEITASEKPDQGAVNVLNIKLSCARNQADPNRFLIGLDLKILADAASGKVPTYTGELSIEGYFRIAAEVPEDRKQEIVVVNGAGMLFGAMREMVNNITARGPWPSLMLTTMSFVQMARNLAAAQAEESANQAATPVREPSAA